MINNFGYNITLSLPSTNISSLVNSFYNNVPQVQIRLRLCGTSFPYYNVIDQLCYTLCPNTTYANSTVFICYRCPTDCLLCLNGSTCTTCVSPLIVDTTTKLCVCPSNTYYFSNACHGCHYSCLTCISTGQYYNCLTCDASKNRTLAVNSAINKTCDCITDFV